jgi:probable O-glycosylation ligase (exosortase A-associated)
MLRTLFVAAILIFGAVQSLRGPFYGLLFYLWLAYFRPETWLWTDFVSPLNLSLILGICVLGGTVLSDKVRLGFTPCLMVLLVVHSLVSTLLSDTFAYSFPYWEDFAKSTTISILMITLVNTERRLRLTFVIIALSLGMEAAKQGWAQFVLNPGGPNINDHPMFGDNNGVAVGMLMLVPITVVLGRTSSIRPERWLYRFLAVGVLYRAIFTYSRGGFLACAALGLHYLARSRRKLIAGLSVALVLSFIVPVLPQSFWDRMGTINSAAEDVESADRSIQSRLHFWRVALVMAADRPIIGVGHNAFNANYDRYDFSQGEYSVGRAVHSSWLGVLAELGYPGFLLFVTIMANAFRVCRRAQRLAKKHADLQNLAAYAVAIEAALVVFAVGGAFVSSQYIEMVWHMVGLSCVVDNLVRERVMALADHAKAASRPAFSPVSPVTAGIGMTPRRAL